MYIHVFIILRKVTQSTSRLALISDSQKITRNFVSFVMYRKSFHPAYGKLDVLSSLFPIVPHVALAATATRATQEFVKDSLKLDEAVVIEANHDHKNIFL